MKHRVLPYLDLRDRAEPLSQEQEAQAVLLALVGHNCGFCAGTLSRATGYFCCGTPHCPICGLVFWHCGHCVAEKRQTVRLRDHNGSTLQLVAPADFKQTPKCYRLAEQAGQLTLALDTAPSTVIDLVREKKTWKQQMSSLNQQLLETALRPDIRTAHPNASGHYRYLFFSLDPYSARDRVFRAMAERYGDRH